MKGPESEQSVVVLHCIVRKEGEAGLETEQQREQEQERQQEQEQEEEKEQEIEIEKCLVHHFLPIMETGQICAVLMSCLSNRPTDTEVCGLDALPRRRRT